MKKFSLLISAILLFSLLVACASNHPSPTSESDEIATIVAGTLTAIPTSTSVPTVVATIQPTSIPPVSQGPILSLNDFLNKELMGENDHYSIYMINPISGKNGETGEIIVYDKNASLAVKMNGAFTIFGSTVVYDDGKGEYVLLSVGTYTDRGAIVLSLAERKQAVDLFCTSPGESCSGMTISSSTIAIFLEIGPGELGRRQVLSQSILKPERKLSLQNQT